MAKSITSINVDTTVKAQAQELFSELGLDFSTAVGLFLRQAVREQRIPFEIRINAGTVAPSSADMKVQRRMRYFSERSSESELTSRNAEEIDRSIREARNNDRV